MSSSKPVKRLAKPLLLPLSLLISLIFFIYLASLEFTVFDMAHHLFFTRHYRYNWFSLIDCHVAGGLDLSTYPPLAYQIMAMLSLIFPLKLSYYILLLASWLSLSYFSSKFFINYLKIEEPKFWLTFIFIFFSTGILVIIFVFGQLTTIIGLSFGFASLYWFSKFLDDDKETQKSIISKNLIFAALALSLSAFSHNFSFFLVAIFYGFIMPFQLRTLLKKPKEFLIFLLCCFILILPIYYPSLSKASVSSLVPKQEVTHWSREPLANSLNFERWFSIFGLSIFMVCFPVILYLSKLEGRKKHLELYVVASFFFLIGLGRTTPLVRILGGLSYWLTYERFSLMSSIIFVALFSIFLPYIPKMESAYRGRKINILHIIFIVLFIVISIEWLFHSHELFFDRPIGHPMENRKEVTDYILDFLNKVQPNYRYQTFGYGRPIGDIYLYSKLSTLDTDYFTGRTIPWVKDSGIDEIDQVRDREFLNNFMDNANNYSVKYIITFSEFYHQFLKMQDWKLIKNESFDSRTVMIWTNPDQISEVPQTTEYIGPVNYLWGILPPVVLLVFLILLAEYNLRRNRQMARRGGQISKVDKMRICVVTSYPPEKGNLAEFGYYLVNELAKKKKVKEVIVLANGKDSDRGFETNGRGKIKVVRCWKTNSLFLTFGIIKNIKKYKPDLVLFNCHVTTWGGDIIVNFFGTMLPTVVKKGLGLKTVVSLHAIVESLNLESVGMRPSKLNLLGSYIATKSILNADKVVVTLSHYIPLLEEKYGKRNIVHIPHGTFGAKVKKARSDGKRLLTFGFWRGGTKNLPLLLQVFKELKDEDSDVELIVAGKSNPNFPGYIEKIKENYKIPGITYTGYVPDEKLDDLFKSATIVVLPYMAAIGTSGVIHLAASYGKPVIISDIPNIRKTMEEEGLKLILFKKTSRESLKSALQKLLADKKLRTGMAQNNLQIAKDLSFEKMADRYVEVFEEVLHGG